MSSNTSTPRLRALKSAPLDSWVVLSRDESTILASGSTFEEASAKADALGTTDDAVIIKTPKLWASLSV